MQTVTQIRAKFLDYFKKNGHEIIQSSPLVPHNDPTLMFTNAGMVQFKDVFTQNEKRSYNRAASSQKCVRAGGKHNDLDNVGYTARHHTFFEMLGNFSFGNYFKDDAIKFAWELLTKEIGINKEKLLVTVYHNDDEAFNIWKKVAGLSDNRIIRISTNDNFWAMGDTGPCGPCSEIFFDHGEGIPGGPPGSPDQDGDRFIEIWNLVFMQFEQMADGSRKNLPAPSIDTGMGLERIAAVLQGVHDNYDIDLFKNLISASVDLTKNKEHMVSHRVIADHLRSMCFLMADGVMPSNEGRGYVLRRIMRRAMRHARQLGANEPVIYRLVPALIREMGDAYPELHRAEALITEIIKLEEERFGETLGRGLKLLDEESSSINKGGKLAGEIAFKLYDTYGFPYDLTVDILRNREISVDEAGFTKEMAAQKERAKAAWKGSGATATDEVWFEIKEKNGATEFLGYENEEAQASVSAILKDGKLVDKANSGDDVQVVLNQTPFYGESGGQQGDSGILKTENAALKITDTKKMLGAVHVHVGKIEQGSIKIGDTVTGVVDKNRRSALRSNHSATHILHAVLREVLGGHVTQKGSLVAPERLRFDFSHPKAVSRDELLSVETKVNDIIRQNTSVGTRLMAPDDAIKAGAMALFGEKYGDEVRVVDMGLGADKHAYSVELCGGTHVKRTGDIGLFKILTEGAIAAGVRRIEAVTGSAAFDYVVDIENRLVAVESLLKSPREALFARIEGLLEVNKKMEKDMAKLRKDAAMGGGSSEKIEREEINGVTLLAKAFEGVEPKELRDIANDLQRGIGSGVVAVASNFEGKASVIVSVSDDLTSKISAVDLVKSAAEIVGAQGAGGRPAFAQTGGSKGDKISDALSKIRQVLAN